MSYTIVDMKKLKMIVHIFKTMSCVQLFSERVLMKIKYTLQELANLKCNPTKVIDFFKIIYISDIVIAGTALRYFSCANRLTILVKHEKFIYLFINSPLAGIQTIGQIVPFWVYKPQ